MRPYLAFAALAVLTLLPGAGRSQETTSSSSSSSSSSTTTAESALPAGVMLPEVGTVYLVVAKADGGPLLPLHPAEMVANSHAAGNFARSLVYAGPRMSLELKGASAMRGTAERQPAVLVRLRGEDPELLRGRVRLVRVQPTKDRRLVANAAPRGSGRQREGQYDEVAVVKADPEPAVWVTLTPEEPLEPGEYCVVILAKDTAAWPEAVYDFHVSAEQARR